MERKQKIINMFFNSTITYLDVLIGEKRIATKLSEENYNFNSKGVTVIIGIAEGGKGRMILDMSKETALKLTSKITGENYIKMEKFVLETLAEIGNMLTGHGITTVNNRNQGLNLRLTPPSIFSGKNLTINVPKVSITGININTVIGEFSIHIGFEKLGDGEK